jgi:histidinol dehydrogenase
MRVLHGMAAAREAVLSRPRLEERDLPEHVVRRMAEVFGEPLTAAQAVERIIAEVRSQGDRALLHYTSQLDGVAEPSLVVTADEIETAYRSVPAEVLDALRVAAERIRAFHQTNKPETWVDFDRGLGQLVRPMDRVGLYIPGGRAAYPSTVLMTAIPAKVAGVPDVVLATPPDRDGNANPLVLAAAKIAGIDRIFKMGGAQAIAALAYGTPTVPRVDKICGPGNLFVVLAKRLVFGQVAIDGLHGPSEAVVFADQSADPRLCAADLLAQAEHDELATAILVTDSKALLSAVQRELQSQLATLERAEIIGKALEQNGFLAEVEDFSSAVELVNLIAPEHLSVMVSDPWAKVRGIRHTGAIFLGASTAAALGDYVAGPSHVMPTNSTARFSSPLRTEDFLKVTSLVSLDAATVRDISAAAATLARAEGLTAHARAIEARTTLTDVRRQ